MFQYLLEHGSLLELYRVMNWTLIDEITNACISIKTSLLVLGQQQFGQLRQAMLCCQVQDGSPKSVLIIDAYLDHRELVSRFNQKLYHLNECLLCCFILFLFPFPTGW